MQQMHSYASNDVTYFEIFPIASVPGVSFPVRCSLSEFGANLNYSFFAKYISSLNTENYISLWQYLYQCVCQAINLLFTYDFPQILDFIRTMWLASCESRNIFRKKN